MSYLLYTSPEASTGLIPQPGRAVNTFPSGLVRVDQTYLGLTANAATHRAILAVGNDMPDGDTAPCIDGLKIFPEAQERRREDGFTEYIVSAYGRLNMTGRETVFRETTPTIFSQETFYVLKNNGGTAPQRLNFFGKIAIPKTLNFEMTKNVSESLMAPVIDLGSFGAPVVSMVVEPSFPTPENFADQTGALYYLDFEEFSATLTRSTNRYTPYFYTVQFYGKASGDTYTRSNPEATGSNGALRPAGTVIPLNWRRIMLFFEPQQTPRNFGLFNEVVETYTVRMQ
jgi:hypothetical protein